MDRSPLHPLRLLPALLATADQGRRHFENEIGQWLAAQSEGEAAAATEASAGRAEAAQAQAARPDHPVSGTPNVPNAGESIPEAGQ